MYIKRRDYRTFCRSEWAFISLGVVLAMLLAVYVLDPRTHRCSGSEASIGSAFGVRKAGADLVSRLLPNAPNAGDQHEIYNPAGCSRVGSAGGHVVVADFGTTVVLVLTAGVVFYVPARMEIFRDCVGSRTRVCQRRGTLEALSPAADHYLCGSESRVLDYVDPNGKIQNTRMNRRVRAIRIIRTPRKNRSRKRRHARARIDAGQTEWLFLPEGHTDSSLPLSARSWDFLV